MNPQGVGNASSRQNPIQPLPTDVVAQIKSSASVTSLTGVVIELLKNALDANATHVDVTVDFGRAACSVEDNGIGIAPSEFRQDGGLCKLYCTSKYYPGQACLGCNGTFLASLAAMCLIHVVSRHHQHRSHNLLTLHYSKVIDRQLPAQSQYDINARHGTRVTVRNLFGNLPVRVKQRAALVGQKSEYDRLWATLKRDVTGLLLSWTQPVSLRIRDGDGNTPINIPLSTSAHSSLSPSPSRLNYMLNLLTKANYITVGDWSSWIPTSASTSTISIKGAISLDPAPHKHVQFISVGLRNLSIESGHNELIDEVNRIFSLSSFGVVEDYKSVDAEENARRQKDNRFKHDGYTNRQLTARKGVDRYPMFHFRIALNNDKNSTRAEDYLLENKSSIQAVIGVLNAMITQWLSVHNFRPRKSRANKTDTNSSPTNHMPKPPTGSTSEFNTNQSSSSALDISSENSGELQSRKRKRETPVRAERMKDSSLHPFAQWSRIKSGKADFFETYKDVSSRDSTLIHAPAASISTFNKCPVGNVEAKIAEERDSPQTTTEEVSDQVITLTEPTTKQTFLLNARTGVVLTRRPPTRPLSATHASTLNEYSGRTRLTDRPHTTTTTTTANPWLSAILQTWRNPVFQPTEKSIEQACSHEDLSNLYQASAHAADQFSSITASKLSKTDLKRAQVLAQLDKKFILASMQNSRHKSSNRGHGNYNEHKVLVLIDQHAADERIQVEMLLSELCRPPLSNHSHAEYRSQLGHRSRVAFVILEKPIRFSLSGQEQQQFIINAAKFAAWGILFNVEASSSIAVSGRQPSVLSVTTLPPAISERSKADPQVLISFLRTAVWKYTDAGHSTSIAMEDSADPTDQIAQQTTSWVRQLSTCPEGLIELVNSRACRSAIMFNDELSLQTCQELIEKLAGCVFPFVCAHGRPSMVPLVDLGTVNMESSIRSGSKEAKNKSGFVSAWKKWKSNEG
ncbi:unnamed protein product [Periconia digitata]|uniref:MutL C-terminal dimerisation domain-containing protein n=1 Tax=Periconia digitata TaxID=1303443 RepID=A0A9W4XXQ9_9PLEO|nr:unnamed protein product [Periconia digitata]